MSGYWIFVIGCLVVGCVGLLLAALLSAAHRGEAEMEAYYLRAMMETDLEDPEVG